MPIAQWSLAQVIAQLNSGERWTGNVISYSFPTSAGGLFSDGEAPGFRPTNASQQGLLRLALQTWDDLIPQSMQQANPGSTDLEFGFTNTGIGYAHAYYPNVGSAWFNSGESDLVVPVLGEYGFLTFVHEIGHALGLDHMGNYNGDGNWSPSSYQDSIVLSVMSYFGPRNAASQYSPEVAQADWENAAGVVHQPQTPMVNDIAAIQAMYGVSTTTRADATVYGFHSTVAGEAGRIFDFTRNLDPILTIFDSGGTDTLDLSGWSSPSRIDLTPGAYSSGNAMTNNIATALNTTIENAIGGAGADVLIGNTAANRLDGGAGDDELDGAAGDDVLVPGSGRNTVTGGAGTDTLVLTLNQSAYSVTLNGDWLTLSAGALVVRVSQVEQFQFSDVTRLLAELGGSSGGGGDRVAPQLVSISPSDDSGNVAAGANLVLNFNEPVVAGGGTIRLLGFDGAVVREIAASDSSQVSISGSTVTLNPDTDLLPGLSYTVNIGANAFRDASGNAFAGLSGQSAWNFSVAAAASGDDFPLDLSTSGTLLPGGAALPGRIDAAADGDLFKVTLSAGVTYRLEMNAPLDSPVDPYLMLYGTAPEVDLISFDDDSGGNFNALLYFTPATSGTYYLAAFDYADALGVYSVVASVPSDDFLGSSASTGRLTVDGAASTGTIGVPTDTDTFAVFLNAGQSYGFELNRVGPSGLDDPYLVMLDPSGQFLAYNDDSAGLGNSRLVFTPSLSGTYYLSASDYDQGIGSYTLSAQRQGQVNGSESADNLNGSAGPDSLIGRGGNDVLRGGGGSDVIDGGAGIDLASYAGTIELFGLSLLSEGWLLRDSTGVEGADTLIGVERLRFADGHVALDLDGNAGEVAKILGAVFGADSVYDHPEYVGIGLSLIDGGMSVPDLTQLALEARLGTQASPAAVVNLLYFNLVGVQPPSADLQYFVGLLDSRQMTATELAHMAAELDLNLANIDLVGLSEGGLFYEPFGG